MCIQISFQVNVFKHLAEFTVFILNKIFSKPIFLDLKVLHINNPLDIEGGFDRVINLDDGRFERIMGFYHLNDTYGLNERCSVLNDDDFWFMQQNSQ